MRWLHCCFAATTASKQRRRADAAACRLVCPASRRTVGRSGGALHARQAQQLHAGPRVGQVCRGGGRRGGVQRCDEEKAALLVEPAMHKARGGSSEGAEAEAREAAAAAAARCPQQPLPTTPAHAPSLNTWSSACGSRPPPPSPPSSPPPSPSSMPSGPPAARATPASAAVGTRRRCTLPDSSVKISRRSSQGAKLTLRPGPREVPGAGRRGRPGDAAGGRCRSMRPHARVHPRSPSPRAAAGPACSAGRRKQAGASHHPTNAPRTTGSCGGAR